MSKFYYRPIKDKVHETYEKNAGAKFNAPENFDKDTILIIEASSEQVAKQIMIGIVDISMWQKAEEE